MSRDRPFYGLTGIEVCVVCVIVMLLLTLAFSSNHKESVEMPKAYAAWVKQTGNAKNLTYEEWRALVRAGEKQGDAPFIYILH